MYDSVALIVNAFGSMNYNSAGKFFSIIAHGLKPNGS